MNESVASHCGVEIPDPKRPGRGLNLTRRTVGLGGCGATCERATWTQVRITIAVGETDSRRSWSTSHVQLVGSQRRLGRVPNGDNIGGGGEPCGRCCDFAIRGGLATARGATTGCVPGSIVEIGDRHGTRSGGRSKVGRLLEPLVDERLRVKASSLDHGRVIIDGLRRLVLLAHLVFVLGMGGGKHGSSGSSVAIRIRNRVGADARRIGEAASDGGLCLITQLGDSSGRRGTTAIVETEIVESVHIKLVAHARVEGGGGADLVQGLDLSIAGICEPGGREDGWPKRVAQATGWKGERARSKTAIAFRDGRRRSDGSRVSETGTHGGTSSYRR